MDSGITSSGDCLEVGVYSASAEPALPNAINCTFYSIYSIVCFKGG